MAEQLSGESDAQRCRECGCTNDRACYRKGSMLEDGHMLDDGTYIVTCGWSEPDLCTACSPGAGDDWRHP